MSATALTTTCNGMKRLTSLPTERRFIMTDRDGSLENVQPAVP